MNIEYTDAVIHQRPEGWSGCLVASKDENQGHEHRWRLGRIKRVYEFLGDHLGMSHPHRFTIVCLRDQEGHLTVTWNKVLPNRRLIEAVELAWESMSEVRDAIDHTVYIWGDDTKGEPFAGEWPMEDVMHPQFERSMLAEGFMFTLRRLDEEERGPGPDDPIDLDDLL